MRYTFTPGALRALHAATQAAQQRQQEAFRLPDLLYALCMQPESRAAALLSRWGVDAQSVRERWELSAEFTPVTLDVKLGWPENWRPPLMGDAQTAIREAAIRVSTGETPELATEHLLLGIVATNDESSAWLASRGLELSWLERELLPFAGELPPIDMPSDDPIAADAFPASSIPVVPRPADAASQSPFVIKVSGPPIAFGPVDLRVGRLLDAACNRAREGLRVLEDFARFLNNHQPATAALKELRHGLSQAMAELPAEWLLAARDAAADVGATLNPDSEMQRSGIAQVVTANWKRVQESLRSLEEFGKLVSPTFAAQVKGLRYRSYELESFTAAATITRSPGALRRARLQSAQLYLLWEGQADHDVMAQSARALAAAGVDVFQLRAKALDDRELLARARCLLSVTQEHEALVIINDRPDLALLSGADGVHLGQEDLPLAAARQVLGSDRLVGVSTHVLEQALSAVEAGADYIGVGPTFPSGTKRFDAFTGTPLLTAVAATVACPAFAIGGIDLENLPSVLATGIRRVAVSGAILRAADPALVARQIKTRLQSAGNLG